LAGLVAVCLAATSAQADEKPLWEIGAGTTALAFPDYRGSSQTRSYLLPVPYVVYRGEFLRADRDGIRSIFFDSEDVEVHVSAGASFPVDSRDNEARLGMPDLAPTVELGPAVDVVLWRSVATGMKLMLRMPARAGFTVQRSPEYIGWLFSPRLTLDLENVGGLPDWTLGLVVSPVYGDRRFHRYFYSVSPEYATPSRPAYDARAGYGGTEFLAALWKRYPHCWIGGFVRYDALSGAVFDDSPLVKTRSYFAAGIAIAWIFGESSQLVAVRD